MADNMLRFIVQEHHARQLHYDFRLEMGGVLKSWALPKGPSMNSADKRLSVMVEDHVLEYYNFEGIIPPGNPGAGPVVMWDRGGYRLVDEEEPEQALARGKLILELTGEILKGGFSLVRMKGRGENNWLLIKRKDTHSKEKWALKQALTGDRARALVKKRPPCFRDSP